MDNHKKLFCVAEYMMDLWRWNTCRIPHEREEIYYALAETLLTLHVDYEVDREKTYIEIKVKK